MLWVGDYARRGAELAPDRYAIITAESGEILTYRELDRRVDRAVLLLQREGLTPGDRLAYLGRNSGLYFVLLLAAARAGYLMAPLNWRCRTAEIAFFLADCSPKHLFCDAEFWPVAEAARGASTSPQLHSTVTGKGEASRFVDLLAQNGARAPTTAMDRTGDCLLACSDGVWHYFTDDEMGGVLERLSAREASEFLIDKARTRSQGGGDNLSLVVVKLEPLDS